MSMAEQASNEPSKAQSRTGGHRHLIYLIDGTWLWPGSGKALDVYSNIYRMNLLLDEEAHDGKAQIIHYIRGLGGVDGIRKYTSGGFGYGIDEVIADLYINVCSNYLPDDKIYIFGFSRGAVIARALSGLISKGILKDADINLFAHVWGDFIQSGGVTVGQMGAHYRDKALTEKVEYKDKCSDVQPTIEFLGVFDTVVGGHRSNQVAQKLRMGSRKVEFNVKSAVQLLALDETRPFFWPVLWTGQKDPPPGVETQRRYFEQLWMPGVHSDVGGAYSERYLGDLSLITMIDRVIHNTKLRFKLEKCVSEYNQPRQDGRMFRIHNEYTKGWRYTRPFALDRTIDTDVVQTLHPYVRKIAGHAVVFKDRKTTVPYRVRNEFLELNDGEEFISGVFKSML
jgi:uncharacterized protein (DUF2235 family)